MRVILRDLIKEFPDFTILSGEAGLDNEVKTVSVMDAPDIYEWMKGGEFLITSGFSFREDPFYLLKLIRELEKRNVAGLGIKMVRYLDKLPEEVIDLSNQLNFPVIDIPYSYAFTDVINPVLSKIVNDQAEKLSTSEKIHNTFTQIAINEEGIDKIIEKIGEILKTDLAFIDLEFNNFYIESKDKEFIEDIEERNLEKIKEKYCTYPIETHNDIYGYIFLKKEICKNLDILENITLEHASTVLKLEIQKKISQRQIEEKYRDEFIQDLIFNNIKTIEEVNSRASSYNWKMENGLTTIIVDIDDYKSKLVTVKDKKELDKLREKIFETSKILIKNYFIKSYYTLYSDIIVFLIEPYRIGEEDYFKNIIEISKLIQARVQEEGSLTVSIGIGSYQEDIMKTSISFLEAQKAIRIGRKIYGNNKIHIYKDLGIYKVLYDISESEDGELFYNSYLKPLLESDKENDTEYILTSNTLVRNDWNFKKTSRDLFLHYNTILYRFEKISELLEDDFKTRESKFKLELALRLKEISSNKVLYMDNNKRDKTL